MPSLFKLTHSSKMAEYAGIPGPEPGFPMGNAGDFLSRWPWEACADYGRRYGGMSLIWLMGTPAIVLNDPKLIESVLESDRDSYYKDAPHDAVAPVIGEGDLFIANGDQWKEQRQVHPLSSPGVKDWLATQVDAVRQVVLESVDRHTGQPIADLIEPVRRIIYDAMSVSVWGNTLGDQNYSDFLKMARVGHGRMLEPPTLQKIPTLDPFFYLDRDRWNATFRDLVQQAVGRPNSGGNALLHLTLRTGISVSADQLAHMLSGPMYFGGVFSSAAAVVHTLRHLADHVNSLTEVLTELQSRQPLASSFDLAALMSCEKLDQAVREALRLSPPVPLFFRSVLKEKSATLGGKTLPSDTMIFITNWLLHKDPAHWPDAEKFQPSRWANGGVERDPLGSGYFFPFGRGPRTCVGQEFALFLIKMTLVVVLARVRVSLDLSQPPESDFFFAVQHPKELKARFQQV